MVYQYIGDFCVTGSAITLYKPLGLSTPSNHNFHSLLTCLSTRLTNKYLVTRVVQCEAVPYSRRHWQANYPAGSCTRRESMCTQLFHVWCSCIIGLDLRSVSNSARNSCIPLCILQSHLFGTEMIRGFLQISATLAAKHRA